MLAPSIPSCVKIVEIGVSESILDDVVASLATDLVRQLRETGLTVTGLGPTVYANMTSLKNGPGDSLESPHNAIRPRNSRLLASAYVSDLESLLMARDLGLNEISVSAIAGAVSNEPTSTSNTRHSLEIATFVTRKACALGLNVRGHISSVFEGNIGHKSLPEQVLYCATRLLDAGCYEVSLQDTAGAGSPMQTQELIRLLTTAGIDTSRLAACFHNFTGQANANVLAAYECGVRVFDSSISSLRGSRPRIGMPPPILTEDLVYMFERTGIRTGVNLSSLVEIGLHISRQLSLSDRSRAGTTVTEEEPTEPLQAAAFQADDQEEKLTKIGAAAHHGRWLPSPLFAFDDELLIDQSGLNVKLTLNRPGRGNSLTVEMIETLTAFFHKASALSSQVSRIVIAASGKNFCTGMDISRDSTQVGRNQSATDAQFLRLSRLFEAIELAPQLTIASIQGPAYGGGIGLAFACDVRIAASSATMRLNEVRLGLCPATISRYLVREWGCGFTREAMITGRAILPAELERIGAIAKIASDPVQLGEVLECYLCDLKGSAPQATRMCKELTRLAWPESLQSVQTAEARRLFTEMMRPESEGAFGVQQRNSGVKEVDWDKGRTKHV